MKKRNKSIAKVYSELKDKETSLKSKIKNEKNEDTKSNLNGELYAVQDRLKRGAPNF